MAGEYSGARAMVEFLEARQLMAAAIDLRLASGAKTAVVSSVGQVVNLEVWAVVTGLNGSGADDGIQVAEGSFLSANVNGGAALGTLDAKLEPVFSAAASQSGVHADLDADTDLDVGSNKSSSAGGFYVARSSGMTFGTISGKSSSIKIGTLSFTVTSLRSGTTNIIFRPRNYTPSAVWQEDGSIKTNADGAFVAGAPFVLTRTGTLTGSTSYISGTVFSDTNFNGIKDSGENPLAGYRVYIDKDRDGIRDSNEAYTFSSASGYYKFDKLAAGSYRVRQTVVSPYAILNPTSGYYDVSLGATPATNKNFANTTKVLIKGTVFSDANSNGLLDAGTDKGLSGWRVYADKDFDGVLDAGESLVLTDAAGVYRLIVDARSYQIRVVQQTGYKRTSPGSGYFSVNIPAATSTSNKNFAEHKLP